MLTLLLPIDGSPFAARSVAYAIARARAAAGATRIHLLNVQTPAVGVNVKLFVKQSNLQDYYREAALGVLRPAAEQLREAGVTAESHIGVGDIGMVIAEYAASTGCNEIVVGTHGRGGLMGSVLGSVAQKVVQLSVCPVVLVK